MSRVVGIAMVLKDGVSARGIPNNVKLPVVNPSALWCSTPYCLMILSSESDNKVRLNPSRVLWVAASSTVSLLSATRLTPFFFEV